MNTTTNNTTLMEVLNLTQWGEYSQLRRLIKTTKSKDVKKTAKQYLNS